MDIQEAVKLWEHCQEQEIGVREGSEKCACVDIPGYPNHAIVGMVSGIKESERYLDYLIERGDIKGEKFYVEYPEFNIVFALWVVEKIHTAKDNHILSSIIGNKRPKWEKISDAISVNFPKIYEQIYSYIQVYNPKLSKLDLHLGNFGINSRGEIICFDAFYGNLTKKG